MPAKRIIIDSLDSLFKFAEKYGNPKPLRRTLLMFHRSGKNKRGILIVEQEQYFDKEIKEELIELGLSVQHKATRLDLYFLEGSKKPRKGKHLGKIIIRPPALTGSQTILRISDASIIPPEGKGFLEYFITSQARLPVQELGRRPKRKRYITSYPFFQQHWDKRWQCGFATLRMFSRWLNFSKNCIINVDKKFHNLSLPKIDELLQRKEYSQFTQDDFVAILNKMGVYPLRYVYNDPNNLPAISADQIIYSYIESGLPVFIIFGTDTGDGNIAHVVTVIGHDFNPDSWWPEAEKDYYSRIFQGKLGYLKSIAWVDFIIHDDNYGPFLTLPKEFLKVDIADKIAVKNSRILEIIVPFRKDISIYSEKAEALAFKALQYKIIKDFVTNNASLFSDDTKGWQKMLYSHLGKENIALRTFLVKSKELASKYFEKNSRKLAHNITEIYRKEIGPLPELVWFIEISIPEIFAHGRYRLGEVIIDPTINISNIEEFIKAVKYIHIPGIQCWFCGEKILYLPIQEDKPYRHFIRKQRAH